MEIQMLKLRFTVAAAALTVLTGLPVATAQQGANDNLILNGQLPTSQDQTDSGRYEARRTSTDSRQQQPTVTQAIVQKLQKANENEIELAKMAMQKTDHSELKQLTQTIVRDHEALNQELQQFSNQNQANSQGQRVPTQLCQIADQACDNAMKMTKDMLTKYEGQDFQMAFLGQQCVAHTMMLAELKAIESTGPQELQPVAQEAISKVEKHLEKAKQLAKKLEDDEKQRS
ncbi:putative secreted protein [Rhodopirellula europaea SH398]|jgi:predicted outer membrane protein|uniref:Putative secreted protein n=2 Tax=Rhodopirellula TaxID=265488 RepID=M5RWP0_9BACT|nr:putative secreted protein [Rhodopirellula europaea SH398]